MEFDTYGLLLHRNDNANAVAHDIMSKEFLVNRLSSSHFCPMIWTRRHDTTARDESVKSIVFRLGELSHGAQGALESYGALRPR